MRPISPPDSPTQSSSPHRSSIDFDLKSMKRRRQLSVPLEMANCRSLLLALAVWIHLHSSSGFMPLTMGNAWRTRHRTVLGSARGQSAMKILLRGGRSERKASPLLRATSCSTNQQVPSTSSKEEAVLAKLMEDAGVLNKGVSFKRTQERGLGVFASRAAAKGDVILSVPLTACILAERWVSAEEEEEIMLRPRSEVAEPEALTWDVRLAVQLLRETDLPETWWGRYAAFMPKRGSFPQPSCLPLCLLKELQHDVVERGGQAQQDRLRMLFPSMMPPRTPETSTKETELQWGFAAVRSRAYACTPPKTSGEAGDVDTFAFVPFFDLINHGEVDGDGGLLEGSNVDLHARPETSSFELYASRNLKGGEEILTCYKPRMENMLMFALFGFVPTGGNPHDRIDFADAPVLNKEEVMRVVNARIASFPGDYAHSLRMRMSAAVASLPTQAGVEARRTAALIHLDRVRGLLSACKTTLEEDEAMLTKGGFGDERLASVVRYRLERKALLSEAAALLEKYHAAAADADADDEEEGHHDGGDAKA